MKKILYILVGLIILGVILFFAKPNPVTPENKNNFTTTKKDNSLIPDINLPFSNDPKDKAWELFQTYLNYNKARDIEKIRSVVYKISPVCEDQKTIIDCESRMNAAYGYGSQLKKADFENIWEDDKQLILSSNFWEEENDVSIGRFRAIIFFIKDQSSLKLLSFSPAKGAAIQRSDASIEELKTRAIRYTEDSDNDGKSDYTEECLDATPDKTCTKTNPTLRDSDSDGFWDGLEALF